MKLLLFLFLFSCSDYKIANMRCSDACYTGPEGTEGVGACSAGVAVCDGTTVIACEGEVLPSDEYCDAVDNDCDGVVDNEVYDTGIGEDCGNDIGSCSLGSVECVDGEALCVGDVGPEEETCDAEDNDCNGIVDDLSFTDYCYDGDPEDLYYGECHAGILVCDFGVEYCDQQQLPGEETCDGLDNDCDGFVDEDLSEGENVDIVFILDRSGSMASHFSSVANATQLFATSFTGVPEFRFALLGIPSSGSEVEVILDFSDAATFQASLASMSTTSGGWEASYDATYFASEGSLGLSWREDSRKYEVLFTDETGQSYVDPAIEEADVAAELSAKGITFYGFISSTFEEDFDDIATDTGGQIFYLGSATQMEDDLSQIFSDECW